jgi:hypothetical protein
VGVLGITQGSVPSFAVLAAIVVQEEPALVEYSIFTLPVKFEEVQVILCELPTTQFSPPSGEVTVIVGGTTGLPRHPLTNSGVNAPPSAALVNSKLWTGGHTIVSTGTYWVESQEEPVVKYIFATGPLATLPGARSPVNQTANTFTLFLALSIEEASVLYGAAADLVPTKLTESKVISKFVAVSGKARGIENAPKFSSLTI